MIMNYENIAVSAEGNTTVITITRPQALNALNAATITELGNILDKLDCDSRGQAADWFRKAIRA